MAQNVEFSKANFPGRINELSKAEKELKDGDRDFNDGFYRLALQRYLKANDFNPNNADLNYNIGICYLNSSFKNKAKAHFEKAYSLKPNVTGDIHYWLGYCYHLELDWDKAEKEYDIYLTAVTQANNQPEVKKARKRLEECGYGREMVKKPIKVKITNLGAEINSSYTDYNPVLTKDQDQLMFTSRRPGTTAGPDGDKDITIDEYWEDIYVSYSFNQRWTKPKNIGAPINTVGHEATDNLSPNGERLLIFIDNRGQGDIYESAMQEDLNWSKPELLKDPISTKFHESSASLSTNLDSLYFVSERPSGIGGKDIYLAIRNVSSGKWTIIQNLGPNINTEYDEESVYLMPDGKTLYFSSRGHNSMGGYDIFKSELSGGQWGKPINLGYPLNTADDDVNLIMTSGGKKGYYASVRYEGFGERDLYQVELGESTPEIADSVKTEVLETQFIAGKKTANSAILKGLITDSYNRNPIEAELQIFEADTAVLVEQIKTDPKTGTYAVYIPAGKSYLINVTAPNYTSTSGKVTIPPAATNPIVEKDFMLTVLSSVTTILKGKVSDIKTHQPLAANLVIRDNVKEVDVAQIKTNTLTGEYEVAIPAGRTYSMMIKSEDYMTAYDNVDIPIEKKGQIVTKDVDLNSLAVGNKIVLKNIFYDFDKATLRPASIVELNHLVDLLNEYPTMRIEISSHTDNKGTPEYNIVLSNNRSKSVVTYLINHGIDPARLENRGYGLTQPIASNDTDAGRQMNRRTEFRILSK